MDQDLPGNELLAVPNPPRKRKGAYFKTFVVVSVLPIDWQRSPFPTREDQRMMGDVQLTLIPCAHGRESLLGEGLPQAVACSSYLHCLPRSCASWILCEYISHCDLLVLTPMMQGTC